MPNQIFSLVNPLAMVGWVLLAVFPGRAWAMLIAGRVLPLLLSCVYTVIIGRWWWDAPGGFSSLAAVTELFTSEWVLLADWVHYLAFDLLVGSLIARDAHEHGMPRLLVLPLLLLTFMFGPAGWLFYLAVVAGGRRCRKHGGA